MKKLLKSLFSNDDSVSSKRVFGGLGIVSLIVWFYIIKLNEGTQVSVNDVSVINTMIVVFGLLVAGESVTQIWKQRKGK